MFSNLTAEEQYTYLVKCSNVYYESGNTLIDDSTFDKYVSEYELKSGKKFQYLGKSNNKKSTLPVYMGSLDKCYTNKEISLFLQRCKKDLICSIKLDGCSMLIYPDEKTKQLKLATRGDGIIGSDVSHLLEYIKIPKTKYTVRGEIIMKRSVFETYYKENKNARNFVSGLINSKTINKEALQRCDFLAYSIPNESFSPQETFSILQTQGFITPFLSKISKKDCTEEYLSSLLLSTKQNSDYEMDGLVISDNYYHKEEVGKNPNHTIAFKKNADSVQATVVDVLWEESRYGLLKPRIKINPIEWGGVTITYASGKHAKFIVENNIGPGTIVSICRSGDVIPDITGIIMSTIAKLPSEDSYEWTESVDIRSKIKTTNSALQLSHFLTICGAKGLKEATIQKCIDSGINSVDTLLSITKPQLLKIDGIKDKSADKIIEQISVVKSNITLVKVLEGSCMFEHFGEKKLSKIVDALPELLNIILTSKNKEINKKDWIQKLNEVGIKTQAETFIQYFELFLLSWKDFCIKYLSPKVQQSDQQTTIKKDIIKVDQKCNWKVVFTGFRDATLKFVLEKLGATITDSISKNTTHLIVKDKDSTSTKVEKAQSLGVKIYTVEEINECIKKLT
jgi:DNA ligase (NAD+)